MSDFLLTNRLVMKKVGAVPSFSCNSEGDPRNLEIPGVDFSLLNSLVQANEHEKASRLLERYAVAGSLSHKFLFEKDVDTGKVGSSWDSYLKDGKEIARSYWHEETSSHVVSLCLPKKEYPLVHMQDDVDRLLRAYWLEGGKDNESVWETTYDKVFSGEFNIGWVEAQIGVLAAKNNELISILNSRTAELSEEDLDLLRNIERTPNFSLTKWNHKPHAHNGWSDERYYAWQTSPEKEPVVTKVWSLMRLRTEYGEYTDLISIIESLKTSTP